MRVAFLALLTMVAALCGAPAAFADTANSTNWAGYAVHGASFRSIVGSWREPAVNCRAGDEGYSAYWVGLGGFSVGSSALEQIGTEADCLSDGRVSVSAWYEMVPAASVAIPMTVAPGDLIDAAVTVRGGVATLTLADRTRHRSFSRTVRASAIDVSSAEWIVEAPSQCLSTCITLPLADFGSAVFSAARAEPVRGPAGTITDPRFRLTTITLRPDRGHITSAGDAAGILAVPSAPTGAGSVFAVELAHARLLHHTLSTLSRTAPPR